MEIGVITNPNSRKNQNRPLRDQVLQSIIGDLGTVRSTPSPEYIKPVLRDFLRRRARYWVSDGGDGALHWMLRYGLEVLEEEEFVGKGYGLPATLPTNGGSIDFVAFNVGIEGNAETILERLCEDLELGRRVEEVEVDSMAVEGIEVTPDGEVPFKTFGFAVAAGGIGQRFFAKLDEEGEHSSMNIVSVLAKTVTSFPVAMTPLRNVPGMPRVLRRFARDMFEPTMCKISLDGKVLPYSRMTGVHIASMSLNLGGVLRFFGQADVPGQLHTIVGAPTPLRILMNLPRMHVGLQMKGDNLYDGPCREMTMEAMGEELLAPVIDGEYYRNVRKITFGVGPRVRVPKVVARRGPVN